MCLPKCEDYSYQYISNPNSRQCEYCGPHCTRCTLGKGCTDCSMDNHGYYLTSKSYQLTFPYNTVQQPSTQFQTCQSCSSISGTNGRCDSCSKYTDGFCESCYQYVNNLNSTSETAAGGCTLCTNSTFQNCLQCNSTNKAQCLTCNNGYFLNSTKLCQQCSYPNCGRCNTTQCQECSKEYFYHPTAKNCTLCTTKNKSPQLYELQDYRCTQCNGTWGNSSSYCQKCDLGYQNSTFNATMSNTTCQLRCGIKQYPDFMFTSINGNDNIMNTTICKECPSQCYKCTGNDPLTQCTECYPNQYLSITNSAKQSGVCVTKITSANTVSFNIYVSNLDADISRSASLRNGDQTTPLIDIQDAFTRAQELAAQYTDTVKINIYLTSGIHYLLRNRGNSADIYQPTQYYDPNNLNFELYINPVGCASESTCTANQVTLINKRREGFLFDVPVKLHIRHVIVDSLDSILPSLTTCLGQRRQCCQISGNTISNTLTTDTSFSCSQAFNNLQLDLQCNINMPRTMFRMRLNNRNHVSSPNQLKLENVEVNNIFYDMNSVVNFTEYGGNVQILNTKFQRISICGSVFKNYYTNLPLADLTQLTTASTLSQVQINFIAKMRRIQQSYVDNYYDTIMRGPTTNPFIGCPNDNCFSLEIKGSTFAQIPFNMMSQSSLNLVNNVNGVRHQGSVINLINFKGDVLIQDSIFRENKFNFDGCDNILNSLIDNPAKISSINNFNQLYNPDSAHNLYQLKSIVSILNHEQKLYFYNNQFLNNIGLKGIVNIDLTKTNNYPLFFYKNNFSENAGIFDSSVLNLRVRNDINLLGTTYTSKSNFGCGGVELNSNTFVSNYGCYQTNGAIYLYCYNSLQNSDSNIVKYVPSYDSQYLIGNSGSSNLISEDKSLLSYDSITHTYTPYSYNSATTPTSINFNTNLQWTVLSQNNFTSNYAGVNKQIVDIQGFPIVIMKNDIFSNNQNYFNNSFNSLSSLYQLQTDKTKPTTFTTITQSNLRDYQLKSRSILTLTRSLYLLMSNVSFDNNYISDSNTNDALVPRSNALLLVDFYGFIVINDSSRFLNHVGIRGIPFFSKLLATDVQLGFKTSLINYQRCQFSSFIIQNVQFQHNQGFYDNSLATVPLPYIFQLRTENFITNYQFVFDQIFVNNNTFYNGYGLIYLDIQNLNIKNSIFSLNGKANDNTNNGMLVVKLNDTYEINLENNTFDTIFTNNMSAIYFEQQILQTKSGNLGLAITISNNIFNNIRTSSTGNAVLAIEGNQGSWTSYYSLQLNILNSTFKNIQSQLDQGLFQLRAQTIKTSQFIQKIFINNSTFSTISQGSVFKISEQNIAATQSFTRSLLIQNSIFSDVANGNVIDIKQQVGTSSTLENNLQIENSNFTKIQNGIGIIRQPQIYTSTSNIVNNVTIFRTNFTNFATSLSLSFEDGSIFKSGSKYTQNLTVLESNFQTINGQGIRIGAQTVDSISDIDLTVDLRESAFQDINNRAVEFGTSQITSNGNFKSYTLMERINLINVQRSPILIGIRNISVTGTYNQVLLIQDNVFKDINNLYGAISILQTNITSGGNQLNNMTIKNCQFLNFVNGNGIYLDTINYNNLFTTHTDILVLMNSTFYNFTNGSAIYLTNLTVYSKGNYFKSFQLYNSSFELFLNRPSIFIGPQLLNSQSQFYREVISKDLKLKDVYSDAFYFGYRQIIAVGIYETLLQYQNCTFQNIGGNAVQVGDQSINVQSSAKVDQIYSDSIFTNITGNAFDMGSNQIYGRSSYQHQILTTNLTFALVKQNAFYFKEGSTLVEGVMSKYLHLNKSSYTDITLSAVNISSITATTNAMIFQIIADLCKFNRIGLHGISHGARNMLSTNDIYSHLTFTNSTVANIGQDFINIGKLTAINQANIDLLLLVENNDLDFITGNGFNIHGYDLTTTKNISIIIQVINTSLTSVGVSGLQIGQIDIRQSSFINRTLLLNDNEFILVTDSGVIFQTVNTLQAQNMIQQSSIINNTFKSINKNALIFYEDIAVVSGFCIDSFALSGNTFNQILSQALKFNPKSLTCSDYIRQNYTLLSNQLTAISSHGLQLPYQIITTYTTFEQSTNASNNTFTNVGGDALQINSLDSSSQNSVNKTSNISFNTFTSVSGNAVFFGYKYLTNSKGFVNFTKFVQTNNFNGISKNAISWGDTKLTGGSSWINFTRSLLDNNGQNIQNNGITFGSKSIQTTNEVLDQLLIDKSKFQTVSNSSIIIGDTTIVSSKATRIAQFKNLDFNTISNGVGIYMGKTYIQTLVGSLSYDFQLYNVKIQNVLSSTNGYGVNADTVTLLSPSILSYQKLMSNLDFSQIALSGLLFNDLKINSTGYLFHYQELLSSKFTNIISGSAMHLNNQTLNGVANVNKTILLSGLQCKNIGVSGLFSRNISVYSGQTLTRISQILNSYFDSTGDSGIILTSSDDINVKQNYIDELSIDNNNFNNNLGRGIYIGNTNVYSGLNSIFTTKIKNSAFNNDQFSAFSAQIFTIKADGNIVEDYQFSNLTVQNMIESRGIFFNYRDIWSTNGMVQSNFLFNELTFETISKSQGIDFFNQTIEAKGPITQLFTMTYCKFNKILIGSGFRHTNNTFITDGSIKLSLDLSHSSFSNINSENGGSSIYINQEQSNAQQTYEFDLTMNNMTFSYIQKGGVLKFRDYMNYAKTGYIFNVQLKNTKIQNISSGVALQIIKDLIQSDSAYTNKLIIKDDSIFKNISTLNGESAILLQESFIQAKDIYQSTITLSDTLISEIPQGPSIYFTLNHIESSNDIVQHMISTSNLTFKNLRAIGNSSIQINQFNIYAKKNFYNYFKFENSLVQNVTKGSTIKILNQNITSATLSQFMQTYFLNCTFDQLQTQDLAAIILIDEGLTNTVSDQNLLNFELTNFTQNSGALVTSSVYVTSNNFQKTTFTKCKFDFNYGLVTNEIFFGIIQSLDIIQCEWKTNQNNQNLAQFLYKYIYDFLLTIEDSTFNCGIQQSDSIVLQFDESGIVNTASLFRFSVEQNNPLGDQSNQLKQNLYTQCNSVYKGSIFRLSNGSQVYDEGSQFTQNSALFGGVAYLENANTFLQVSKPKVVMKNIAFYGGFIYLLQQANATFQEAQFSQNRAVEGAIVYMIDRCYLKMDVSFSIKTSTVYKRGVIVALAGSWFELSSGVVELNTAYYESAFIFMSDANDLYVFNNGLVKYERFTSLIYQCRIQKNEVLYGGKLISVINGDLSIQECNINKNYIYQDTQGIFAAQANIWINNTIFQEDYKPSWYTQLLNKAIGDMNGAYLSIGRNSSIYVNTTTFIGGRAVYGGCISVQGTSKTLIQNCSFKSCSALLGGGIYAVNFDSLTVESSTFSQNVAFRGYSQNIYTQNSKLNVTLRNNSFSSYHNSVFLRDGVLFYVAGNQFKSESNRVAEIPLIEYGGGLHIINTLQIQIIEENVFQGLTGYNGGAIYISIDINYKNLYSDVAYLIDGALIDGCTAMIDGGGIYIRNIKKMKIQSTKITNCKAPKGNGGGVQFICYESWNDKCELSIWESEISYNSALIGGGIRWNWVSPKEDQQTSVINNKGTLYGQDYASFGRELVLLADDDEYLKYFNKASLDKKVVTKTLTKYVYSNVQSGGYIPTAYLALVDDQGQVVSTNSGSMIQFDVTKQTVGQFETQVSGVNKFFSTYGVFNVSGLLIVAAPNSNQSLILSSLDAVDLQRPSNQDYLKPAYGIKTGNLTKYQIEVGIIIRGCINGEGLRDNGACYQCPKGTYLLKPPVIPTECKVCPGEKAVCNGGSNIGPKPGYWRKDNETDNFIACFEPTSCLGMLPPLNNPVGDCLEGYYGALCTSCMPGYSRSGDYACSKCPPATINLLRISGIMVAVVAVVTFMVRGTLNSAAKKNTHSVYMKIFMNHLQLLSICAAFKFQWPEQVSSFFSSGSVVSSSQESLVSFDCQMDDRNPAGINRYYFRTGEKEMRIVYQKTFIMAGLPVLLAIIVASVWIIILKRKNQMDQLETKFVASLVIIFFLVHPTITSMMIDIFNCQSFDQELRLMKDLQVICNTGLHSIMAYGVALPCIGLWGIGIPASVWFLMNKDKEKLDTLAVKQKFGFLYNGYKRTNFFWEIVIMYRKIGMIAIAVFMNRIGIMVQALVILILLVGFLQLNNMRRPFATRALNDIEDLSLMTGIITIYCAIFFISSKDKNSESFNPNSDFNLDNTGKLILFGIIVFGNFAFILTWFFKFIAVVRLLVKERYQKIYVIVFLCCRQDKLEKENEQLAKVVKRETIIEKIEEVQFFLKNMKKMYTRQIFYEGHQQFLKMLYFIEAQKATIDMTEKKHNFYIQGKMARDRKFDPERMAEILDERVLSIDEEFGGGRGIDQLKDGIQKLTQKRRKDYQKQSSVFTHLKSNIGKSKKSQEDQFSPKSTHSQLNTADLAATNLSKSQIIREPRGQSVIKYYQDELDDTKLQFDQSLNNMDDSQNLDDTQRGLLSVTNNKLRFMKRKGYILNASSSSQMNAMGLISGSGEISEGQRPIQQSSSTQLEQLMASEEQKKKKRMPAMEDRLERSRNAKARLEKQKKHQVFVDDVDDSRPRSEHDYIHNEHHIDHDNFREAMNIMTDMDFSKLDNLYFMKGKQGQFDQEFLYEDDSARQKRLMRGLTRRLNDMSAKQGTKKAHRKSPSKQYHSSNIAANQNLPQLKRRKSTGESSGTSKAKHDLKIDFLPPKDQVYNSGKITSQLPNAIKDEVKGSFLKSSKQENLLDVESILKMTRLGKEWRKSLNLKQKLRQPDATTREIIFDNFTIEVRDYVHEHPESRMLMQDFETQFKKKLDGMMGIGNSNKDYNDAFNDDQGSDEENDKQSPQRKADAVRKMIYSRPSDELDVSLDME